MEAKESKAIVPCVGRKVGKRVHRISNVTDVTMMARSEGASTVRAAYLRGLYLQRSQRPGTRDLSPESGVQRVMYDEPAVSAGTCPVTSAAGLANTTIPSRTVVGLWFLAQVFCGIWRFMKGFEINAKNKCL